MIETTKKRKRGSISEEDTSTLLQRYPAPTLLAMLQEIIQSAGVKLNWKALVGKTSTGISNAREYQMLWRHLAYRQELTEDFEDGAEPLDDDSDLEYELEPYPSVSSEASAEAAACVKVLIASGFPSDSSFQISSTVEAPLTINIPNGQSLVASSENTQPTCPMRGMNITVPVSVQKQILPAVTSAETSLEGNGSGNANLPARRKRKPWSEAEDLELIAAVRKCGVGNWSNILRGDFKGDRSASQLAQRWAIIKKRLGNLNVEGTSTASQLSEAQLATRSALSLALDMPNKNLTAACTNNSGLNTTSGSSALPTASGEASVLAQGQFQQGHIASVQAQAQNLPQQGPTTAVSAQNQPQKGPATSVLAQNQPQKGPTTSVSAQSQPQKGPITAPPSQNQPQKGPITAPPSQNQPQKGPTTSFLAQNQAQKGPITALPAQNQPQKGPTPSVSGQDQPQKGPTTSVSAQNQPQQGPTTSVSAHNQSQKGPITAVTTQNMPQQGPVASVQVPNQSHQHPMTTKTSPRASSGSTSKCRLTLKKPQTKPFSPTGSILDATAVAAGARIGSPKAAASLLKAAQSKNAIHITTSSGSSVKSIIPSGTSSPVVTSPTKHPGSVRSARQRVEHTPSASSSSLNVSIQQCNAVASSSRVEGPMKEEQEAAGEITGSRSDSLPKEMVQENGACVPLPNNESGEGVKDHKQALSNQESESKNLEGEIKFSVSDSLPKEVVLENGAHVPQSEPGEGVKEHKQSVSNQDCESKNLEAVAEPPNEKSMVEGDQVEVAVAANLVEESQNADDSNGGNCSR